MPKIQLITNVGDFGLFRPLAQTRTRLIISTVVGLALTHGAGLAAANYVLEQSPSVMLNLLIITGMMMLVLMASYLMTVLLGDLFFPGPWRRNVILGEDVDDDLSAVEDHSAEFLILLFLCVVGNALVLNYAADDFFAKYHGDAFYKVMLRADSPEDRLDALADIPDPMNHELWEDPKLGDTVVATFDDPNQEVRERAYWTAGFLQAEDARDDLLSILESDKPASEKAAAAIALAKFEDPTDPSISAVQDLLSTSDSPAARVGALRALGLMGDKARPTVPSIIDATKSDDESVMIHAYWALRKIRGEQARLYVREVIESGVTGRERCAAYDAMKLVATHEDVLWARKAYRTASVDKACEPVVWWDNGQDKHYILWNDSFREKVLKIIANTAAVEYEDFFQRVVNDPGEDWRIREVASAVLKQIDKAR
ncbi:MAG: HEAT repeat domain-containing protein [Myxococcota bacterium]